MAPKSRKRAAEASPIANDPPAKQTKASTSSKTVVIEACKSCNAFKTRAAKLETAIKGSKIAAVVSINPEKPRKGCFEVTVNGEVFLSLLDMPRPFTKLKALDMESVGKDVIKALK